jgi:hypothetical protein
MASITYWSQLLPSPRAPSVAESLAARVRDPAWLLARQWQLGEFQGADAGSPAFVRIGSHTAGLTSATAGGATTALAKQALLEPLVESEPFTPDLATRVEIGQSFEALLAQGGVATTVRDQFRAAYPISAAPAALPATPDAAMAQAATAAFLKVCAGRAIDGAALYAAAKIAPNNMPAAPVLAAAVQAPVKRALASLIAWVEGTWGALGTGDPAAWDATRLEYGVSVAAGTAAQGSYTLSGTPDTLAEFDWYSFDLASSAAGTPAVATSSVIPGHVRFRGMPNARWWDFEGSKTDFGAIIPDTRDLAKLLFMDFLLLHGDDWYLAPLTVPTGSLCFIDSLVVTDVFGVTTAVPRADAAGSWTMFSTTDSSSGAACPFLFVPAAASATLLSGAPIEEVHLLRDETADMAWAIERIVEGPIGLAQTESLPPASTALTGAPPGLLYQLQTPLPSNWFPLLPTETNGAVVLLAGTMEGQAPARGRILKRLSAPGFQMPDGEVPRSGVRVQRVACRARSADGQMHLWIARRRQFGAGAASSGLRFDVAVDPG